MKINVELNDIKLKFRDYLMELFKMKKLKFIGTILNAELVIFYFVGLIT